MASMEMLTDRALGHRVGRDAFEEFRESRDDGFRYELLDGEILVTPAPGTPHQRAVVRLIALLSSLEPEGMELLTAPYDVLLETTDGDTTLQPDILLARTVDLTPTHLPAPPVLVVEVLSHTTWHRDLGTKMAAYAEAGVEHYWVVTPTTPSLTVYRLDREATYREVTHVEGSEQAEIALPLRLTLRPGDLVRTS